MQSVTRQLKGITATFEIYMGNSYLLRSLSNHRPVTAIITVPISETQSIAYTLRPFQKLVVYPPVKAQDTILSLIEDI